MTPKDLNQTAENPYSADRLFRQLSAYPLDVVVAILRATWMELHKKRPTE